MKKAPQSSDFYYLGIFEGHADPAVAIVKNGQVIAYSEEERHIRNKHAFGLYPKNALRYCLETAKINIDQIAAVGVNWNTAAYADGRMADFYKTLNQNYPVDPKTIQWQNRMLQRFNTDTIKKLHEFNWQQLFGPVEFPPIIGLPHHYVHAFQACSQSPFDESICLTIDGSGDQHCTVVWHHKEMELVPLREINIPHSLGWFYAAITEYLGFQSYDGEYKVMGLAAYGKPNLELRKLIQQIVYPADDGVEYRIDPTFIHYGLHSYSDRYTDKLVELLGKKPRLDHEKITAWHQDLAYETQYVLEEAILRLVQWAVKETGIRNICIGGGVGLNIKMNSRLQALPEVNEIFPHPLCSDGGAALGAALAASYQHGKHRPEKLTTLALGYDESNESIERALKVTKVSYEKPQNIFDAVAQKLEEGKIVGWFQGKMEGGPRALGQRSILADPRHESMRDKVNEVIKFREYWRPFCPSMLSESAGQYLINHQDSPFMVISFEANDQLKQKAPAIVHIDGTARVQLVHQNINERFYNLIKAFEVRTGLPVLLNTSFNIKGEPIVCTVYDALRTFWATGLDVLAVGDFLICKPKG